MTLYILNLNGAEAGPFTEQQLRAMWLTGGVTVNTEWRLAPQGEWRSGPELPALLELAPPKPKEMKILIALQSVSLLVIIAGVALLAWSQFGNVPKLVPLPMKTIWEYHTVTCKPYILPSSGGRLKDEDSANFFLDDPEIAGAGKDGWELCGVYPEIETVYYQDVVSEVTRQNVRVANVILIFKRSHQEPDN